ncbi:LysE family translocator [Chelatococcus asaccharovorans]|uniref:Threonine/homoserine/homoserine lactone efflux protein n=1 Tax=Chelatococcus asaccharovorans TaxID=28210 RepID=A0A2V3U728_9HYPH|nr:LysE family translocator [Chelatococcus asaccharovorans]MBS7705951.1 LysE family translocator [Chelatococcus asaccharovorans]PXW58972.1 threonine/homoserine/homoserine lactone efflux protein [Chelatococcus asaccharovorans]CAH1659046.1 Threonine/homoserine/homoserine lactone efflux protein [Chelatococcus asaccharovorans]CAH1684315.1 Threonine/homoserine/homoserine lactone efflux protein [Chelatococcus asaccharovorans]
MSGLDLISLAVFASVLAVAGASPGPAVAAILARVLARGAAGVTPFLAGLILGDVVWLAAAVLGLAVVAQTFHELFLVIRYLGAAYLFWLAWKLWFAPISASPEVPAVASSGERGLRAFVGGVMLALGNPKSMMFYLALLPNIISLADVRFLAFIELVGVIVAVLTGVFTGYVLLATRVRRLFTSPRAMRWLNRGSGTVMAGAAIAVATR